MRGEIILHLLNCYREQVLHKRPRIYLFNFPIFYCRTTLSIPSIEKLWFDFTVYQSSETGQPIASSEKGDHKSYMIPYQRGVLTRYRYLWQIFWPKPASELTFGFNDQQCGSKFTYKGVWDLSICDVLSFEINNKIKLSCTVFSLQRWCLAKLRYSFKEAGLSTNQSTNQSDMLYNFT